MMVENLIPTLEDTFLPMVGRTRVVDKTGEAGRPASRRFAVMAKPLGVPDEVEFEVELASFQYRPHALAFAALPEMVDFMMKTGLAMSAFVNRDPGRARPDEVEHMTTALMAVIEKAESL